LQCPYNKLLPALPSLRGAVATKQSGNTRLSGLLRRYAPRNDDKARIVSSLILRQASSRFQFRYETGIRNDNDAENSFLQKTHNSHPFDV
jgi:hypothetical protein